MGAPVSTSAASAAAPASQRSRSPAVGLQQWALEELAHDPEREPLLELRRPRREDPEAEVRRPGARLLEQPRLPHPRGTLDDQGCPGSLAGGAQRGANALELVLALEQRGRPGKRGLVHAQIDRTRGLPAGAMFGGRCQGMCPMCGAPGGRMLATHSTFAGTCRSQRSEPGSPRSPQAKERA